MSVVSALNGEKVNSQKLRLPSIFNNCFSLLVRFIRSHLVNVDVFMSGRLTVKMMSPLLLHLLTRRLLRLCGE